MEKIDQETHDFMNVESFSQLPFIRSTPSNKEKGIRLFGKEFVADSMDTINNTNNNNSGEDVKENNKEDGEINKPKFECHYCCRNFPTSQALGGHQNAHKRERQNAKRGHIQIPHGGYPEPHVYGYMNYHHRLGSGPPTPPPMTTFQPWNHHSTKFHGLESGGNYNYSQAAAPINGNPLWRISQGLSSLSPVQVPMFFPSDGRKPSITSNPMSLAASQITKFESKSANIQDQVSLDLRL